MAMALTGMANRIFAPEQAHFDITLGLGSVGQCPFYPHHWSFDGTQDRGINNPTLVEQGSHKR